MEKQELDNGITNMEKRRKNRNKILFDRNENDFLGKTAELLSFRRLRFL